MNRNRVFLHSAVKVLTIAAFAITGCDRNPNSGNDPGTAADAISAAKSELARELFPAVDADDRDSLVTGNTRFALDLYTQLSSRGGNLFFSPYSISCALAMTYGGSRNETEREMREALRFTLENSLLHKNFNALTADLDADTSVELEIANQAWGRNNITFVGEYLDLLALNYGSGMNLLDFRNHPDECRVRINDWVSEHTGDKINDLLPKGSIEPVTALVLTNAIYFFGDWETPFDAALSREEPFHLYGGGEVAASMMRFNDGEETVSLPFAKSDSCLAAELPYAGERFSMVVLLPPSGALDTIQRQLNVEKLDRIIRNLSMTDLIVKMPSFSFTFSTPLKRHFMNLGMTVSFTEDADFTGMRLERPMWIDEIYHKAFIKVNETGTEAAAATAVVMADTVSALPTPERFIVDRPFLFVIRDRESGTILFMGRVVDPTR
ncbi:MAG: serpin family protein [Chitinispirillaceae bacterium]|nr:serpin family protein [Chitinispirillaceae bacterium]